MDNDRKFRQDNQPHNSTAGDLLVDAGSDLLFELVPDSLGVLAIAVFIIGGIFWVVWSVGREIFGGPS